MGLNITRNSQPRTKTFRHIPPFVSQNSSKDAQKKFHPSVHLKFSDTWDWWTKLQNSLSIYGNWGGLNWGLISYHVISNESLYLSDCFINQISTKQVFRNKVALKFPLECENDFRANHIEALSNNEIGEIKVINTQSLP